MYEAAWHWEDTPRLLDRAAWPESCALLTASTGMETIKTQGAAPHKRGEGRRLNAIPESVAITTSPTQTALGGDSRGSAHVVSPAVAAEVRGRRGAALCHPGVMRRPSARPGIAPPAVRLGLGSRAGGLTYPGCTKGVIADLIS